MGTKKMSEPQPATQSTTVLEMIKYISVIQATLKVPKGQKNKFGGYQYRSCEDILQALKPHLMGGIITFNDDVVEKNGENFLCSTVILTSPFGGTHSVRTHVGLETHKKGMDKAQIAGAAISYAHKYLLQNMFAIDLTSDPDTKDNTNNLIDDTRARIAATGTEDGLKQIYQQVLGFFERGAVTEEEKTALIDFMRLRKDAIQPVEV